MALRSYDSWKCDPVDYEYKKICNDEDVNPIKTQKEAVQTLATCLFTAKFDELSICNAMQKLMDAHKIEEDFDIDIDELEIVSVRALNNQRCSWNDKLLDLKRAVSRHLDMLKKEIYGSDMLDFNTINGAIGNLEWLCDQTISDKKVNVRRA